jgi:hypothetical protein
VERKKHTTLIFILIDSYVEHALTTRGTHQVTQTRRLECAIRAFSNGPSTRSALIIPIRHLCSAHILASLELGRVINPVDI